MEEPPLLLKDAAPSELAIPPESAVRGAAARRRQVLLACLVAGYVVCSVVASVCGKLNADAYGTRLVFFRQQLIVLLYCVWVSIATFLRRRHLTAAMWNYPFRYIFVMAFLDALADFLSSVGSVNTPGDWQTLLQQLTTPATIAFSLLLLGSRFRRAEYAGALVIVAGSALAVTPVFTSSAGPGGGRTRWYSVLIYTCSVLPSSASGVLKESAFKAVAFDIFMLSMLVTWLQLVLSWLFVPLLSLDGFGGIPMRDIPGTLRDGFWCLLGHSDIPVHEFDRVVGHCSSAVARYTLADSSTDFVSGVFELLILQQGSAVLYVLSAALALPLANMAFSVRAVMGSSTEPFSWYDVGGLAVVMCGFALYRSEQIRTLWVARRVVNSCGGDGGEEVDAGGVYEAVPAGV